MGRPLVTAYEQRIAVERRLLAGLFLYPRAVDLEARNFLASDHGVIFEVLQDAYERFPWPAATPCTFDDMALAVVLSLVQERAHDVMQWLGRSWSQPAHLAQWAEEYFINVLMMQAVTAHGVADLVEQVRECPRCGK